MLAKYNTIRTKVEDLKVGDWIYDFVSQSFTKIEYISEPYEMQTKGRFGITLRTVGACDQYNTVGDDTHFVWVR